MKKLKKAFAILLCFAFVLSILTTTAVAADTVNAVPTASVVLVNGEEVAFDAYNINDNNYFKLRDLAFVLNGTEKQFEVEWDGEANAILLTSGESYTEVGGEMSGKGDGSKTAALTTAKVYLDGVEINLTAYNIEDNNYFKLRDIGAAIDFVVDWDGENNAVIIDTSKGYAVAAFIAEDIIVGEGTEWELNGLLTLPAGASADDPVPAVVLVHGSGPSNMDAASPVLGYINKPFRDIAEYLSSNGIAVIRYDKRTYAHLLEIFTEPDGSLTVYEETIEDAILAAELLKADPRIDKDNVYIVGLSLGGMFAPRIHAEGGDFAGIISLAGSPRFLLDIMKDQQMAFIEENLTGAEKAMALVAMASHDAQVAALMALSDEEAKALQMTGGVSAYYYKDMYFNPISKFVEDITVPFLIMQGENDTQIYAETDFVAWQELLEGRENAEFKLYEKLNHIFMVSETGGIEEYFIPGNVDAQVLADIVEWIFNQM